jgi:hypothetical protein
VEKNFLKTMEENKMEFEIKIQKRVKVTGENLASELEQLKTDGFEVIRIICLDDEPIPGEPEPSV